jgi:hypothetical protein
MPAAAVVLCARWEQARWSWAAAHSFKRDISRPGQRELRAQKRLRLLLCEVPVAALTAPTRHTRARSFMTRACALARSLGGIGALGVGAVLHFRGGRPAGRTCAHILIAHSPEKHRVAWLLLLLITRCHSPCGNGALGACTGQKLAGWVPCSC